MVEGLIDEPVGDRVGLLVGLLVVGLLVRDSDGIFVGD